MAGSVESVITGGRHPHRPDSMETNSHPINKTPAPTPTRTQTIHSHRPSPRFKKNTTSYLKGIYPEFQVIRGFSQKIPAGLLSYDQIHS